jgi:glycosyltransferase involved in cell wall biosynthesis
MNQILIDRTSPRAERARELLSVVVPVYNEVDSIGPFIKSINAVAVQLPPLEILFVDDGSSDSTETVIRTWAEHDTRIRLLCLSRNFGKEAALTAGLHHAKGSACVPMDVDLQDPPELLPEMVSKWRAGAKIVNARRIDRSADGWAKTASARTFYNLFNAIAERPIPSDVGDFRLLDREVVDAVARLGERARFNKALFSWVGFSTDEVVYERPARAAGTSAWSWWRLWNLGLDGIFQGSVVPLRMWTYLGTFLALLGFAFAAFIFFRVLMLGVDTPGYASTVMLILIFGGTNLFALGILGEYIGRIYTEVRQRPLYILRKDN